MKRQFTSIDGVIYTLAELGSEQWMFSTEASDRQATASIRRAPDGTLLIESGGITRPAHVSKSGDTTWVTTSEGTTKWQRYEKRRGGDVATGDVVLSPMTGKVVVVHASVGQSVSKGDVLVVVEAMKMEQPLAAPRDGVVAKVSCATGDLVDGGIVLVSLEPAS
ncbi:MAG: hypothetical protein KC502_10820 [Myxococcales bacterium]|nr:hypothetical protein [Myxococcales bacterium]